MVWQGVNDMELGHNKKKFEFKSCFISVYYKDCWFNMTGENEIEDR